MLQFKKYILNEVAEIIDSLHKTPKYSNVGFPMVRATEIQGGALKLDYALKVPKEIFDEFSKNHKSSEGDLVMSRVGTYHGKVSYVQKNQKFCLGQNTLFIVPQIDSKYLYYSLITPDSKEQIESFGTGSSQKTISLKSIKEIEILVPDQIMQKKIANILSSLDDKIELNRRTNLTLEQIARTLFKKYFVDDIDPENLQEGWSKGKISDYVSIVYGKNLPTNQLLETGYPVFGGNGLIGFHTKYLYGKPQVIIACRGSGSGTVNQTLPNSFVTNNSLVFEYSSKANVGFSYLKYSLKSSDLMPFVTGSAQPQITIENISNLEFIKPEKNLLKKFNEIGDSLEYKILSNHFEIEKLTQIRDSLLPGLMSGEIEVNVAEGNS